MKTIINFLIITILVFMLPVSCEKDDPVIKVTSVSINKSSLSLVEGESEILTATILPDNADNKRKSWGSSKADVASVDNSGRVTAHKPGSATITVATEDGNKTASCSVTVTAKTISVTDVELDKKNLTLVEGDTETLKATVSPTNATNKNVSWKSDKTDIATVDGNGKVIAVKAGTAKITVTTEDGGKTATCDVTVDTKTVSVTGVSLDKTTLKLTEGSSETLKATITPSDATNKNVSWKSDKTDIATVDKNGKVIAVKAGTAKITVTTEDGSKTATCNVTVEAKAISVTGVALNKTSLNLVEGSSETLTATVSPANATNKKVTWKSDKTDIATVDSNGKITAMKAGTATITVTTEDGTKTATCKVTVQAISVPTVKMSSFSFYGEFGRGQGVIEVNGLIVSDGGGTIIDKGVEYEETSGTYLSFTKKSASGSGTTFRYFEDYVVVQGEKLRFRVYATNSAGTGYSEWQTAYEIKKPTVRIVSFSSSGQFFGGKGVISGTATIDSNGGAYITERGIEFEETYKGKSYYSNEIVAGNSIGNFKYFYDGIIVQGEKLRYRAYAKNMMGTAYSDWITVCDLPPSLSEMTVTNNYKKQEVVFSAIMTMGNSTVTKRGFLRSTNVTNPTIDDPDNVIRNIEASVANEDGTYSVVYPRHPKGTFYARAYAIDNYGTVSYSNVIKYTVD